MRRSDPMQTAVFASDVHLGRRDTGGMERWARFLDVLASRARAGERVELYVLGDLFEFWHEFLGMPHRLYRPVLEAVGRTVEAGCPVKLLAGNRDFLFGRGVAACGAELVGTVFEGELCGRRVYASHGDELCTRDWRYQLWRRLVRSFVVRGALAVTPRTAAFALADLARAASRLEKSVKGLNVLDIQEAAAGAVAARGFDLVVCGHVHVKRRVSVGPEGGEAELITLPAWCEDYDPEVLELSAEGAAFADPFGGEGGRE